MPRYELASGGSIRFFALDLLGKSLTTTVGKFGSPGRKTTKTFDSAKQAKQAAEALVAKKHSQGYALVDDSGARHGARYFEFVAGKSNKFWEVLHEGSTLEIRYGKIGAKGRLTVKRFDSEGAAKLERDKLITQKKNKGYTERRVSTSLVEDARNPDLEAAIFADPEDDDAYAVLADWLEGEGDPRGKLISLELAGKTKQARAWYQKHIGSFLGALEDHEVVRESRWNSSVSSLRTTAQDKAWSKTQKQAFLWRRGYIHRLRLNHDYSVEWEGKSAEALAEILAHPSGRFIVEFSFNENGKPGRDLQDIIDVLAKQAPASTRKITFGDNVDQVSWHRTGNLAKLWKGVPSLRVIEVDSGAFELGKIVAPSLERAIFRTGQLSASSARAIARAKIPAIQHLEIYCGSSEYGSTVKLEDLRPLLKRDDLPHLRYLGIEATEFSDDLVRALANAKILAGLETLDLSKGILTDAGAETLAAIGPSLAHLECLDLSDNWLTKRGIAAVQGLCKRVVTKWQNELDDDDDDERGYYVSVGE